MSKAMIKRSKSLFSNIDVFKQENHLSTSGIGVGLSSSYKLAKSLGGTIEIESFKGQGTTVQFSVQAFKAQQEQEYDLEVYADDEIAIADLNVFGEKFNFELDGRDIQQDKYIPGGMMGMGGGSLMVNYFLEISQVDYVDKTS